MTQVAKRQVSISNYFNSDSISSFLEKQLGDKKGEFVSNVIALTDADKNLQQCDPADLIKCAMNATALNLPLNKNLGYAYVVPYKDRNTGKLVPQFQIGYKGFVQLSVRSSQYKTINTCEVREGEIKRNKFTGHIEFIKENEDGKVVGYLAYIEMLNGFQQSLYMTVKQVEAHAKKYSKNFAKYGTGLWKDEFDLMAKKTVLKLLLNRYGILSTEMQKAVEVDQQDGNGGYIDNQSIREVADAEVITQNEPIEEAVPESPKTINLSEL